MSANGDHSHGVQQRRSIHIVAMADRLPQPNDKAGVQPQYIWCWLCTKRCDYSSSPSRSLCQSFLHKRSVHRHYRPSSYRVTCEAKEKNRTGRSPQNYPAAWTGLFPLGNVFNLFTKTLVVTTTWHNLRKRQALWDGWRGKEKLEGNTTRSNTWEDWSIVVTTHYFGDLT
jgi:hypothetical protein